MVQNNDNFDACLYLPMPSLCPSLSRLIIVLMRSGTLTGRMAAEPILPVKQSITIGTMINLDGDDDGVGRCKQTFLSIEPHFS